MTDEQENIAITDAPEYAQAFDAMAGLVEASPHPGLAAAALLNAAAAILLSTAGPDVTAKALRAAADAVPAEMAKTRRWLV